MTAPPGGTGGRSRRLSALSLDDDASASTTNVVQRADKTVPLAIYGGTTNQGATPLPPSTQRAQPQSPSGNVGSTTAPLAAQSAPPVSAVATPSVPTPAAPAPSGTGQRAALTSEGTIDKSDDEVEGPPMAKTPWGLIAGVGGVVIVLLVVAAVVLGGSSKSESMGTAAPAPAKSP